MKPIFCRIGSKYRMAPQIVNMFPEHIIYVEPFVGGGGVYFYKTPSEFEIINDMDKTLISNYRLILKAPLDVSKYRKDLTTIDNITAFLKGKITTNADKLTEAIIRNCNGFSSTYINSNNHVYISSDPFSKLINIRQYKDRLHNTIIENRGYKYILKKYDSPETLFYLDPPYEESSNLYKHAMIDYVDMANILQGIKGRFLLSINDSKEIREIFHMFKIKKLKLETNAGYISPIGSKKRGELLIINY